jgi:hypothetical protein
LRCSRGVVYSSLRRGVIPSVRISQRKIVIPRAAFFAWLNGAGGNGQSPDNGKAPGAEAGASRK